MSPSLEADVLVIGSGVAGLSLALRLADRAQVTVLSKGTVSEGSTLYAQGGVAAVVDQRDDSFEAHVKDTLRAGAGLCHIDAVEQVVHNGPETIAWLRSLGVPFTTEPGAKTEDGTTELHLT
ncbi:MAG: FAD-dependent oxidoreductase, partial [Sulfurifustis sp.]